MLAEIIPGANIILVGNIVVETHDRASLHPFTYFTPFTSFISFYLLHLFILSSASNTLALGVPMFMRMNPSPSGP